MSKYITKHNKKQKNGKRLRQHVVCCETIAIAALVHFVIFGNVKEPNAFGNGQTEIDCLHNLREQ